jgi:hypothetical protein
MPVGPVLLKGCEMHFDFDDLNEEIRVWMDVHDTKTNRNWTAVLYRTAGSDGSSDTIV